MTHDCEACGIEHASAAERDAIHGAVRRVRKWLRREVLRMTMPVATPAQTKRKDAPSAKGAAA